MTITSSTRTARAPSVVPSRLRGWRPVAALTTVAAGAVVIAGAFLPWVGVFAGLIQIPGVRGGNGRVLAAAGALIVAAGLWDLAGGSHRARWAGGLAGFAAAGFSGYLLIQLNASMRVLGGDSMIVARPGPGLPVALAGALAAFATLLLPPRRRSAAAPGGPGHGGTGRPTGSPRACADACRSRSARSGC